MSSIAKLQTCWKKRLSICNALRIYAVQRKEDIKQSLSDFSDEQVNAQILNWIMWCMESDRQVEIRLSDNREQTVYDVTLAKTKYHGIRVQNFKSVPEIFDKLLYHWNVGITYECLSIETIQNSSENADILNGVEDQKCINDLIDEAIQLNIEKDCVCTICMFVKSMDESE